MPKKNIKKIKRYNNKLPNSGIDSGFLEIPSGGIIPPTSGFQTDDTPLVNYLIDLADDLDDNGLEKEAEFVDFLILKFAYNENYFDKFSSYISELYLSGQDIDEKVKGFYKKYISVYNETYNKEEASRKAFMKITEISLEKKAGTLEDDPFYVAEQIVKIIKIMINAIRGEKRPDAYRNISNKIFNEFNPLEMSQKKSPGGAAIGVSLALVKNILNSKHELFIKLVLDEVRKKLGY